MTSSNDHTISLRKEQNERTPILKGEKDRKKKIKENLKINLFNMLLSSFLLNLGDIYA